MKAERLRLSKAERWDKSRAILKQLHEAVNWSKVQSVHCFEPIHELGEVDLSGFIDHDKLFTSRLDDGQWKTVAFKRSRLVPDHFDVIIVPMLGFDKKLHRLGYGAGYYDKFLLAQPKAKKIGVCFEVGKVTKLPSEPHDIALDMIITEDKVYRR